jgi:predicted MFS family arabinose efflux permease
MIWWVLVLVVVTILSYLSDVGLITFMQDWRVPFLNASALSILILLCLIGLLVRMMRMSKKGEKEALKERITELERKLADM